MTHLTTVELWTYLALAFGLGVCVRRLFWFLYRLGDDDDARSVERWQRARGAWGE